MKYAIVLQERYGAGVICGVVSLLQQGQVAGEFDEGRLEAVLSAIPEDLPSQDLCPWFRTVIVPFVRRVLPRGQVLEDVHILRYKILIVNIRVVKD